MTLDCEEYAVEIAKIENQKFGKKFSINSLTALKKHAPYDEVKDSTSIYRIDGYRPEDDSIITISNPQFPIFVDEAVRRTNAVASNLEPRLREPILRPSSTGNYGTQSYAFWPRHKVISGNRLLKRIQLLTVSKSVFTWLCDVAETTQLPVKPGEELINQYIDPLTFLISQEYVPSAIKRIASDTLSLLETTKFRPVSILQHGDFWYGNILLKRSWPFSLNSPDSFYIIDWAGANFQGYPYVDQLRYLMSVGQRESAMSHCLNLYSKKCGISLKDIVIYVCAYAGDLGMNRNEFPLDRYLKLIDTLILKASYFSSSLPKNA